jgi:ATP-dependent DNA helicase RecQ
MPDLLATLRAHFGHDSLRAGQEPLVSGVLSGRDVLAVMPTGAGKSLGFQLPAVVLHGTTLVVSPLISLMKDQVDELNRRSIRAAALHSMVAAETRRAVLDDFRQRRLRLLYIAPERLASDAFLHVLGNVPIARVVVDEAHCVSEWGHDFRPDYRRLRTAADACRRSDGAPGRPSIAAFTATATPEVRDDIVALVGLRDPLVLVAGFDRPNIDLQVRPVDDDEEKHALLPRLVGRRRALVYAATRKTAEGAAATLAAAGLPASAYHAGLPDAERTRVQDGFAAGSLRVVCATNAFGMGIDRPDVERVVHLAIPGSVEAYYQEIGRAGRDGRPAIATLLWHGDDVSTRRFLIDSPRKDPRGRTRLSVDPAEVARRKQIEHKKLDRMVAYAEATGCLRATILRYFGDPAAREPCSACGNCRPATILSPQDREVLQLVLSGILHAGERYGRRRIVAMLIGEAADLPASLGRIQTAGSLRTEGAERVGLWIDAAVRGGLVRISNDQYRTLAVSAAGRAVLAGTLAEPPLRAPELRWRARRRHDDADWRLFARHGHRRRDRAWFGGRESWHREPDTW